MHGKDIRATVPRVGSVAAGFGGFVRRHKRASITVSAALLLVGPLLLTGDGELVCLNAVGLGLGALLLRRCLVRRSVTRPRRQRRWGLRLSQHIPIHKGRLHPEAALLLCPQAGAGQGQHTTRRRTDR